jgi:hypothetical protein
MERKAPNKRWETFFTKLELHSSKEVESWNDYQLLGYFCDVFYQYTGHLFPFTFTTAPGKCKELFFIKSLKAMLNTESPFPVKEYIDWIFKEKIIPQKTQIRSFALLNHNSNINEFLSKKKASKAVTKNTNIPNEYISVIESYNLSASTYGDLAFILRAIEQDPEDPTRQEYAKMFKVLEVMGLSKEKIKEL